MDYYLLSDDGAKIKKIEGFECNSANRVPHTKMSLDGKPVYWFSIEKGDFTWLNPPKKYAGPVIRHFIVIDSILEEHECRSEKFGSGVAVGIITNTKPIDTSVCDIFQMKIKEAGISTDWVVL